MDEWLSLTYGYNAYWWILWDPISLADHWYKTSSPDAIGSLSALSAKESLVETKDYKPMHLMDECLILTNKNHFLVMNPMGPKVISKTLV